MCTKPPLQSADSFTFLHCCIRLAESPCAPSAPRRLCYLLTILCYDRFRTSSSLCVPLCPSPPLISVCLPPFLVSLQFDITVSTLCRSACPPPLLLPPTESVRPFLCLPSCLYPAWCFSDATEVVWTSLYFFFFFFLSPCISIGCRCLPCWCFPIRVAPEVKKLYIST